MSGSGPATGTGAQNPPPPQPNVINVPPPPRPEIKIGQPLNFNGITNKSYARRFLASCESYCQLNRHYYATDDDKIQFALSFMQEGPAGEWAINLINDYATNHTFGTWQDFKDTFTRKFVSDSEQKHAIENISTIKQGIKTIEDFNNEFQALAA